MVRYRSRRPKDDELRARLRELAAEQRRFGYRRLHVLLRHENHTVNRKKTRAPVPGGRSIGLPAAWPQTRVGHAGAASH